MSDLEMLRELNRRYVRSAETSDVRWYEEHLAEDFLASTRGAAAAGSACPRISTVSDEGGSRAKHT